MKLNTEYDYDKSKYSNQYEGEDFTEEIVHAKYRKAAAEIDRGNPLIEALPQVRTNKEISEAYSVAVPGFFTTGFSGSSTVERIDSISSLNAARIELPYHEEVEMTIHNILIASYRNRTMRKFKIPFGKEDDTEILLTSDSLDTKNIAVRILGKSNENP